MRTLTIYVGNYKRERTVLELAQLDDIWYECMLSEYETQQNGLSIIIDFEDLKWSMLQWCLPKYARVGAAKSDLVPVKDMLIHIVNTSPLQSALIQALKPFLSKSFKDKVR